MQQEDDAIFNAVYLEYHPVLRVLAVKWGLPYSEVDDIIQETFLAYFSHYPVDWEASKMTAMLVKILKNKCIDFSRKRVNEYMSLETDLLDSDPRLTRWLVSKDSLAIVEEQEERSEIWEAFRSMRVDWQEIFQLHFIQDQPIEEVSLRMGITVEACRTRISRGRKYLKDVLERN